MLWHSTSNFNGYISDFGRLLSRLESDYPLKYHNRAPYAYVITVPYIVHQCLILLLTGYIALSVMCNHTLILCQPKAAWSATLLKHAKMFHTDLVDANDEDWHDISITPALCMSHSYNHCLDTLCWSDSIADEAYKIAICGNSLQHIGINRYCHCLVLQIPVWKTCVCAEEYDDWH